MAQEQLRRRGDRGSLLNLREDFCGTFAISTAWVQESDKHRAISLDLDPETLAVGYHKRMKNLDLETQSRLTILEQDVCTVTKPLSDLVIGCNFSFCVFKQRAQMKEYLDCVRKSLRPGGMVILELAGGPGMIEKLRERKTVPLFDTPRKGKKKRESFVYVWDQRSYDPITHEAKYAIHFEFKNAKGKVVKRLAHAFDYDWRMWTLPELTDIAQELGFSESLVYWDHTTDGRKASPELDPLDGYTQSERGSNDFSWIAYWIAIR